MSGQSRERAGAAALVAAWRSAFPAFAAEADDVAWLGALRREALAHLVDLGLPHRRLEEWRYTSLAALERSDFRPMGADGDEAPVGDDVRTALDSLQLPEPAAARAVFVDGRLERSMYTAGRPGAGLDLRSFAMARRGAAGERALRSLMGQLADTKTDAFTALNTAFAEDGAVIEIEAGAQPTAPIQLIFVSTRRQRLVCPRVTLEVGEGGRAAVVLCFVSTPDATSFTNVVSEISLGADSRLDWIQLQREGDASIHVSNVQARLARCSRLASHTFILGGQLVRNELDVVLAASGSEADLKGLFLGAGERLADNHTLVDHAVPHCTSRELYKGILGGSARGVFRGRVVVRPDAQKTDASQSNPNLLLTDRAEIDTKPQLEIYADDVKCSHGSTIGRLDPDALFFLRSRGLGEADARVMLMRGFANELCDALPAEDLRDWSRSLVAEALQAATAKESA